MASDQIDILKTLYSQQQSTAHILRERMSKITTATISTLVIIDGWLISKGTSLASQQTMMLILSVIVIVGVALYAVRTRFKEFCAVASLIVRIETAMKIYDKGIFIENESLYPVAFKKLGEADYEHGKNIFLSQAYILLTFGLLSVLLGVLS